MLILTTLNTLNSSTNFEVRMAVHLYCVPKKEDLKLMAVLCQINF